jgi:hypothetical protein
VTGRGLDPSGATEPVAGSSEKRNEPSGSIKDDNISSLHERTISFSRLLYVLT